MDKIRLDIVGVSYGENQSGAHALILGESEGNRRLPIVIGGFEAQAIAVAIENMDISRPLTHDLFKTMADTYDIVLEEIIIYNFIDGVFFAKLICTNGSRYTEIDARTSDAIALAVRFRAPVFTYEFIMKSASILIDKSHFTFMESFEDIQAALLSLDAKLEAVSSPQESPQQSLNDQQLEAALHKALVDEQYEAAASIRDEITRRKNQKGR